ncbi:flagellar export chaperone FliS [uncultured Clostridium sp.]|jgi:flagellar protein FliS|uniref:flagellar export chaperone FliS n=1 Tax=uncultured Clostridium sp. TaxID=59620 RepID=UPI00262D96F5|nr:flagellar export chaperone FliS [uncultured Clostridium sp.]
MYQQNAHNIYKNNSVNCASKEQLLLMLVDGAVKFAKRGRLGIEEKNIKMAHESLVRVQDIFTELMVTLDPDAGAWTTEILEIYRFINKTLAEANMKKDIKKVDEAIELIVEVRDMWHEAYRLSKIQGK